MKNNSFALLFLVICIISCSPAKMYRKNLVPASKNASLKNQYGAYIEATTNTSVIMGEYLTLSNDTLYILTLTTIERIPLPSLMYVNLVLTRTKEDFYLITTGVAVLPPLIGAAANSDYAGEFLTVGLAIGVAGGLAAFIESQRKGLEVRYSADVDQINKSIKYARFPKGFPDGLDPTILIPERNY